MRRSWRIAVWGAALAILQAGEPGAVISGKWSGTLDIVHADGSVEPGQAFLSLNESGGTVAGSAGSSKSGQSPIASGQFSGGKLALQVPLDARRTVRFDLTLEGDALMGVASGIPSEPDSKALVNLRRAGPDWDAATPVPHVEDKLRDNIAGMDRRLFDAYNSCDLAALSALVAEDLEFYHDKTGLQVGRTPFLNAIRANICGKTRRVLVPESLEVHRLSGYGAMEAGKHRFHHPGAEQDGIGEGKFVMLWKFDKGGWKLTRVISYDHAPAKD